MSDVYPAYHTGFRPAEVRLIFRSRKGAHRRDQSAPLLAVVLWYSKIPTSPEKLSGLFRVKQEFDPRGHRRCGIIKLDRIARLCPLAPVIGEHCDPTLTSSQCFSTFQEYYINHYSGSTHDNFRQLRTAPSLPSVLPASR